MNIRTEKLARKKAIKKVPYIKKLKATVNPTNSDLCETIKNFSELALIENLTLQIIDLITKNNLNTRQVNALLECVQVEIKECHLSR